MTPANFERALQAFTRRVPFQRFGVELVSGDHFEVSHPEALVLRGRVALYLGPNHAYRLFDGLSVCQLFDLLAIELNLDDVSASQ